MADGDDDEAAELCNELARLVHASDCDVARVFELVEDRTRLPGRWTVNVGAALSAARRSQWGTAAYLAAVCAADGHALAEPDSCVTDDIWLGAGPVLAWVPPGTEQIQIATSSRSVWIPVEQVIEQESGQVRAIGASKNDLICGPVVCVKYLSVGESVEVSSIRGPGGARLKKVQVHEEDLLAHFRDCQKESCSVVARPGGATLGGLHQVLEYPVHGDYRLALLRPRFMNQQRRSHLSLAVSSVGQTLVGQAAKSAQWPFVVAIVDKSGYVDLRQEFGQVFGTNPALQKAWCHDLRSVNKKYGRSLLSMAAAVGKLDVIESLISSHANVDEKDWGCSTSPVERAAENRQWGAVVSLIGKHQARAETFLMASSPAPLAVKRAVFELHEETLRQGQQPATLREFFARHLRGEAMDAEHLVPPGFSRKAFWLSKKEVSLLATPLFHPNASPDDPLVFVKLEDDEAQRIADWVGNTQSSVCPMSLGDRGFAVRPMAGFCMVVRLPECFLGESRIQIPENVVDSLSMARCNVQVSTTTPCCREKIGGVAIFRGGQRVAVTPKGDLLTGGANGGVVSIVARDWELLSGVLSKTSIRSPEVQIVTDGKLTQVGIVVPFVLFFYIKLQESQDGDDRMVFVTPRRGEIPQDAPAFRGILAINDARVECAGNDICEVLIDVGGDSCCTVLSEMRIEASLPGWGFESSGEPANRVAELGGGCEFQRMCNGMPVCLGKLIPPVVAVASTVDTAGGPARTQRERPIRNFGGGYQNQAVQRAWR
mmetsp:Transcript_39527/g.86246  ORF Transcript_39527/g.86246 Transcript_39527/m.86246 type:complete len:770 (+) Transcript_39527:39-2348(+)